MNEVASPGSRARARTGPVRAVTPEELPDVSPVLFRELDRRITAPYLQRDALPDDFTVLEDKDGERVLVFRGKAYALSIVLFRRQRDKAYGDSSSGVFVISNGAGVASNTVDELTRCVPVSGMIDLKRDFTEPKVSIALQMVRATRPDAAAIVMNVISGTALVKESAAAISAYLRNEATSRPLVLRFDGPGADVAEVLARLAAERSNVHVVASTAELVARTAGLVGGPGARAPGGDGELAARIERAQAVRGRLGVRVDPKAWLTDDRTLRHLFGTRDETRVGVLGYGRTAQAHVKEMLAAGTRVAWVVTPNAARFAPGPGEAPILASVEAAIEAHGDVDIVVDYAPAPRVPEATRACVGVSAQMRLMLVVAEDMTHEATLETLDALGAAGRDCIGPNSPGVMLVEASDGPPRLFKLGNMPAHLFSRAGGMSVIGRSGTVIFDIVEEAARAGIGTRVAWAIGGDRYRGLGFLESLLMLEQDPSTEFIVLAGEAGGIQEQLAARMIATGIISKPVLGLVTGRSLPAGVQYGHLGSIKLSLADDPQVKEEHLRAAGVIVVDNPTEVVEAIGHVRAHGWQIERRRRDALWDEIVTEGRATGLRWRPEHRAAYDLVYELAGHYRVFVAQRNGAAHLLELVVNLTDLGVEAFRGLLDGSIRRDAFVKAFEKSREYVAELLRAIDEIGAPRFRELVARVFSEASFNAALEATPWATGDIVNEAHTAGLDEISTLIDKTMGVALFRRSLAERPWNTAHALRSINNMRWWRFVRAHDRYCTHLTGDNQLIKASWARDPWAAVKLVRGYDRIPDRGLERALEWVEARQLFFEKSRTDPQGLLELGKRAFRISVETGEPFHEIYRGLARRGVPARPSIDDETERMGPDRFEELVEQVFTREAFLKATKDHPNATARALQAVNACSDPLGHGVDKIIRIFGEHRSVFDTPAFHLGVSRNPWMAIDILRAAQRLDPLELKRLVESVLSPAIFDGCLSEHQWGTAQALYKIAAFGSRSFFDTLRLIEDVTRDRESMRQGFRKNPRDLVEIVQVVARLGPRGFGLLVDDVETREAFLTRVRVSPRNAAHLLQEVAEIGAERFQDFVDHDLGRAVYAQMLARRGCNLVHAVRRITTVGFDAFRRELKAWLAEGDGHRLMPGNTVEVFGEIKERALERRFSQLTRKIQVDIPAQPALVLSEAELAGLYRTYPEWGDVIFKLQGDEPMTLAERVDVYRLVSGRKRFQERFVPVLVRFVPLATIRDQMTRGIPLVPEFARLRGITQGPGHRFDAYFHTLEVMDQLHDHVLPLPFVRQRIRSQVRFLLETEIDHVPRRDLLMLAALLHDVGKAFGPRAHVEAGLEIIGPVLERLRLTPQQARFVTAVVRFHGPKPIRRSGEPWDDFLRRGGLDLLYGELSDHGQNPCAVETILLYHADILGRLGDETPRWQLLRRKLVTRGLLERYAAGQRGA